MKRILLFTLSLLIGASIFAQYGQKKEPAFGIKFSGFVKNDFFYDTRKVISAREDHFLLWTANESLDAKGNDINDKSTFQMLSIQSRIKGTITGPEAFGAKSMAVIEADFFGSTNNTVNTFRLRHAFIKLNWAKTELLVGQYWNPMFLPECYPTTVSFNSGAGITPFARNPQIRFSYKTGGLKLIAVAYTERDHVSFGLDNGYSSRYIRNSGIPGLNGQIHYSFGGENVKMLAGVGAGYMSITPQSVTLENIITNEKLGSLSAMAFFKATFKPLTLKLFAVYGENMVNVLYFGGFAIKDTIDPVTKEVSYTPISNGAVWADISTHGKKVQFGLLAGINTNMGTKDETGGPLFGRMPDVAKVYRVSPRVVFISGKMKFAAEFEITGTVYGDGTYDAKAKPLNTKTFTNFRTLLSAAYYF